MTLPTIFPNYAARSRESTETATNSETSTAVSHSSNSTEQEAMAQLNSALSILHYQWQLNAATKVDPQSKTYRIAKKSKGFEAKYAIQAVESDPSWLEASRMKKLEREAVAFRNRERFEEGLNRLLRSTLIGNLKVVACTLMVISMAGVALYPAISNSLLYTHFAKPTAPTPSKAINETILIADAPLQTTASPFVASTPIDVESVSVSLDLIPKQ